jgi:hypothetical protein
MQLSNSDLLVELKYCERCGGLWLRAQGVSTVYCGPCRTEMAALPERIGGPRRKRPIPARMESLHANGLVVSHSVPKASWAGRLQ